MNNKTKSKKRILMVALDFPPCKSAGVQRTLKFAEYLKDFGWEPIILTVTNSAHETVDESQLVPEAIKYVYRSFSFNASRDFSIKGKYLSILKEPDRWWTWKFTAVPLGKKLIKEFSPDIIWSTYPVSTAHHIASKLAKWSNIPWIADYRDPVQSRYDGSAERLFNLAQKIEKKTLLNASKVVFTTKQASMLYQYLYPELKLTKFSVIENGYDEGNFISLNTDTDTDTDTEHNNSKFTLLHSGAVYENGRNPSLLFQALSSLKEQKKISSENFQLVFRGISKDAYIQQILALNINDLLVFLPSIDYMDSLKEMMEADGLLLIQGPLFNNQIPGKVFEYIRSGRPILAYTSQNGATGQLLQDVEESYCADSLDDLELSIIKIMKVAKVKRNNIERYSRYEKTKELVQLLDSMS
ncbi:MAG: glycosyltransferase [Colwellia sp.]|nr:glycosyltransferase [Colwellia sp.]